MRIRLLAWAAISALWIAGTAFVAIDTRPRLPLDISRRDPQVTAAFDRAQARHATRFVLIGAVPPLLLIAVLWVLGRPRPPRS